MRTLLAMIVAAVLGAAAFHAYYRSLDPADRCRWDYAFDDRGRTACEAAGAPVYDRESQQELEDLIEKSIG